jgi:hypothetical protein
MRASGELPMAPYQPRRTQSLGVMGWAVKIIGITADGALPDNIEVAAAVRSAHRLLPQPARTEKRRGAAFLIVHRGAEALWAIVGWWELDILYQRLLRGSRHSDLPASTAGRAYGLCLGTARHRPRTASVGRARAGTTR